MKLRIGHGLETPPTKADDGRYRASCICGDAFAGPVKDHVWRQLADHVVESPGGLRALLKAAQN